MSGALLQLMGSKGAAGAALTMPDNWYDASDVSTITDVSGKASAIADKGNSGDDLAQATDSLRPFTGTTTRNGLNTLDCSTNRFLHKSSPNISEVFVGFCLGYLSSTITKSSSRKLFMGFNSLNMAFGGGSYSGFVSNEVLIVHHYITPRGSCGYSGSGSGSVSSGLQLLVFRYKDDGNPWEIYVNGGANLQDVTSSSPTFSSMDVQELLLNGNSSGNQGFDEFAESRLFAQPLSDEQINAHGNDLTAKWGTTWTPIS